MKDESNIEREAKNLFFHEVYRFKDFINHFDSLFEPIMSKRIRELFNDTFKKFEDLSHFRKLTDSEKSESLLNCVRDEVESYNKSSKNKSQHIFNKNDDKCKVNNLSKCMCSKTFADLYGDKGGIVNKCIQNAKKLDANIPSPRKWAYYEWVDNLCGQLVKAITNDSEHFIDKDHKNKFILGVKLYLFVVAISGYANADSLIKKLCTFSKYFNLKLTKEFDKIWADILRKYQKEHPEFNEQSYLDFITDHNYLHSTESSYRNASDYLARESRWDLTSGSKFTLHVVFVDRDADKAPELDVYINKLGTHKTLDVTLSTKLIDMFKFITK